MTSDAALSTKACKAIAAIAATDGEVCGWAEELQLGMNVGRCITFESVSPCVVLWLMHACTNVGNKNKTPTCMAALTVHTLQAAVVVPVQAVLHSLNLLCSFHESHAEPGEGKEEGEMWVCVRFQRRRAYLQ